MAHLAVTREIVCRGMVFTMACCCRAHLCHPFSAAQPV